MQPTEFNPATGRSERRRVEAVVQTLATMRSQGESLAELAHDARNMVTALALYCDLLEEPGVLTPSFLHYGGELRLVVAASRRLVEKLVLLDTRKTPGSGPADLAIGGRMGTREPVVRNLPVRTRPLERMSNDPIANLREELLANRNLLDAMAGLSITVSVEADGGELPVKLTGEDLTRVLVNLVKNAAESIRTTGSIRIILGERVQLPGSTPGLLLTVEDSGPGIPDDLRERIFEPGFSTHPNRTSSTEATGGWLAGHRGLGLSITRSIIEVAGGRIRAENGSLGGARFEIELPVRTR